MTDVKLHVGYVGRTRSGLRVEIVYIRLDGNYLCDGGWVYTKTGSLLGFQGNTLDIIGSWAEPKDEGLKDQVRP